ncbi:MAG: hypothetical protein WD004_06670 [Actinomycetota bacterium]
MNGKDKQKARIMDTLSDRLRGDERVVQILDATRGADPTIVVIAAVVAPAIVLGNVWAHSILTAALVGGAAGALGGAIAAAVVPRLWFVLTDRRLLVVNAKALPLRASATTVDSPVGGVRITEKKRGGISAKFELEVPGSSPIGFSAAKAWYPEADQIKAALEARPTSA